MLIPFLISFVLLPFDFLLNSVGFFRFCRGARLEAVSCYCIMVMVEMMVQKPASFEFQELGFSAPNSLRTCYNVENSRCLVCDLLHSAN